MSNVSTEEIRLVSDHSLAPHGDKVFSDAVADSPAAVAAETEEPDAVEEASELKENTDGEEEVEEGEGEEEKQIMPDVVPEALAEGADGGRGELTDVAEEVAANTAKVVTPKPRIYIKNLSYDTTEEELEELFRSYNL